MDRSERVRDLFARAVVLPTPDRAAFLDEQCADDPSLRRDVERLLSFDHAEDATGAPFARPVESVARALAALRPGEVISDRVRIVRLLGEGGMGAVYEATQLVPIERAVALKIIKPGMDSTRVLQRFEAERQALALMDHASIARVLDAGIAEDGRPFFVMELVDGIPIDRYCDEHRLDMHARLALFVDVCQAVQHAHQKGIIHRDLKPSNILVAEQDGRAVPKVIDFGIAKAVERKLTDQTLMTEMGLFIGTPEYMSPEQAGGSDVDTRSDIYALGVLLYQLLTGTTPFERSELQRLGFEEILRIIREVEPPRPSTRVAESTTAAGQGSRTSDTATLRRHLRGDLDWIIMRALAKDRRRRYESAHALAVDIRRHVAHEPVSAGPPSAAYHISKFARRHVIVLTASIVVALTLIAATIVSVRFAVDANTARAAEAARAEEANRARTAAQRSAYKARLAAADAAYLDLDVVAAAD
ncbi:MAG: serine/threonine-protein kinase, partial [Planctomycetota bacterium]